MNIKELKAKALAVKSWCWMLDKETQDYVNAANPAAILALIAELENTRAELEELRTRQENLAQTLKEIFHLRPPFIKANKLVALIESKAKDALDRFK